MRVPERPGGQIADGAEDAYKNSAVGTGEPNGLNEGTEGDLTQDGTEDANHNDAALATPCSVEPFAAPFLGDGHEGGAFERFQHLTRGEHGELCHGGPRWS